MRREREGADSPVYVAAAEGIKHGVDGMLAASDKRVSSCQPLPPEALRLADVCFSDTRPGPRLPARSSPALLPVSPACRTDC